MRRDRDRVEGLTGERVPPIAVTITGGDTVHGGGRHFRVPKRDLVTALQLALQDGRLKIAAEADHADTLVRELADFRVKITAGGADQYGAWREGAHDDLVLALALSVWWAERVMAIAARQRPAPERKP
ncbi:hypothetical protein JYK14_22905 [Siccirubricoccus sp. KC 17139]|uniref:Uncharacterized protein n=1 Tax=Siccirubricoccus soli TaxID=2899147 RepID=A0ABT1DAL8_9PROT|nr:hypothetical protein [Siccirubricoccus soli]MCO6418985.1 hypothetical protein [Siccirubricoccus soli]MCP2685120.1 hypothetical protein [Siccirubricoccus soli]